MKNEENTMNTIYGYTRVSIAQQDLGIQMEALLKAGVPAPNIFTENLSGENAKNRIEWNTLKDRLVKGDVVYVYKLDRLGRSMVDVMNIVQYFKENGIFLVILDVGIDTRKENSEEMDGLMTLALMKILALMAEMERTFIMERTKPAIEQAKKNGVKFGRPSSNKKLYEKAVKEFVEANGAKTVAQIIAEYGKNSEGKDILTSATFFRRLKEYKDKQGL